jgi:hypothetical protein
MLFRRSATSPFAISVLKNHSISKIISIAIDGLTPDVPQVAIDELETRGESLPDAAVIVSSLLNIIDEFGSHTPPVYKCLWVLISLMKSRQTTNFLRAGIALLPELESLRYLSFVRADAPYRNRIHAMARAVYNAMAFGVDLPDAEFYGAEWQKGKGELGAGDGYGTPIESPPTGQRKMKLARTSSAAVSMSRIDPGMPRIIEAEQVVEAAIVLDLPEGDALTAQDLVRIARPRLILDLRYDDECESC